MTYVTCARTQLVVGKAFYLELEQENSLYHVWCEVKIKGRTYILDPSLKQFVPKDILDPKTNPILAEKGWKRQTCYIETEQDYGKLILALVETREKLKSMKEKEAQ